MTNSRAASGRVEAVERGGIAAVVSGARERGRLLSRRERRSRETRKCRKPRGESSFPKSSGHGGAREECKAARKVRGIILWCRCH
jgi:hypothetical protein